MKGIYRVLEKGIFKYNDHWEKGTDLDLGRVYDLVRGGIIDKYITGIVNIAEFILNADGVTVCRVKDRFSEPSPAGWTDLMINFFFNDDDERHVCEVQLIHSKMLSQRTTQEGHESYNLFRAATELLQKVKREKTSKSKKSPHKFKKSPHKPVKVVPASAIAPRDEAGGAGTGRPEKPLSNTASDPNQIRVKDA